MSPCICRSRTRCCESFALHTLAGEPLVVSRRGPILVATACFPFGNVGPATFELTAPYTHCCLFRLRCHQQVKKTRTAHKTIATSSQTGAGRQCTSNSIMFAYSFGLHLSVFAPQMAPPVSACQANWRSLRGLRRVVRPPEPGMLTPLVVLVLAPAPISVLSA